MNNTELMSIEDTHSYLLYLIHQLNEISEKEHIPYYAHAGTLIGVLRHGGFIPWDDDVDVLIERKYYKQFVDACSKHLPDEVVLQTREADPYFCEEYIKMCFRDDSLGYSELALDIFVLDETNPNRGLFRWFQNFCIHSLRPVKLYKTTRMNNNKSPYVPHNPIKRMLVYIASILPLSVINNIQSSMMVAEKEKTDYYVDWGSICGYKKATHHKSFFAAPLKMKFEDTYIYTSPKPVEMVNHIYPDSDYRIMPPPEKRKSHYVHRIDNKRLQVLESKENSTEERK